VVTWEKAQRLAAIRFGNAAAIQERTRDFWSLGTLDDAMRDVRYAFRFLRRSPAFTSAAVFSIALGVGANAAVFSVVDRVFFREPVGVVDGGALRRVYIRTEKAGQAAAVRTPLSWAEFFAIDSALP